METMFGKDLTWTCHVCGEERPDHLISVLTKPLMINGRSVGNQNIRYCNDNNKCQEGAMTFDFTNPPIPPTNHEETQQVVPDVSNPFRRLICKCVNFAKSITT